MLERKRDVATGSLLAETRRIVRDLPDLLPFSCEELEAAVAELLACFPVYRSYLPGGREHLDQALARAAANRPDLAGALDDLVATCSPTPTPRRRSASSRPAAW